MASDRAHILVVEDEADLATLLRYNLEREGFTVSTVGSGPEGLTMAIKLKPDLILLDWMLPGFSGVEICQRVRAHPEVNKVPVIMLTARGEEQEKIIGFNCGADDYVTKPFSIAELVARIRAILRRRDPIQDAEELVYKDLTMDLAAMKVRRSGRDIHLGPKEFRLLKHFLQNPEQVFSREDLLAAVWGPNIFVEERTVDVHIRRLRRAINFEGVPDLIRTVRSAGYSLDSEEL